MSAAGEPITILSENESWNLLASVALGRLVTSVDGQPEIFPVNFVVQRRTVLFRTAEGTKLVSAVINNRVSVRGRRPQRRRRLERDRQGHRPHAAHRRGDRRSRTSPAAAVDRDVETALCSGDAPPQITGRRFRFGSEPDR